MDINWETNEKGSRGAGRVQKKDNVGSGQFFIQAHEAEVLGSASSAGLAEICSPKWLTLNAAGTPELPWHLFSSWQERNARVGLPWDTGLPTPYLHPSDAPFIKAMEAHS